MIAAIHKRLDALEEISSDMKEIKEWIATVVRMTLIIERVGDFMIKWAWRFVKFFSAVGAVWAMMKLGTVEVFNWIRSWVR